ncbi:MAG TPA: carboxypeptidase regulatory-like domain-containing protein [Candidatus Binatia bacterium]|nr:carboxypeptidase regulatory-like domain-containing protein [Candidatus Binatia bacterium]
MRKTWLLAGVAVVVLVFAISAGAPDAQTSGIALTGQVTSAEEGGMEGVLVSAKRTDAPITITVVSDQQGRFRFPAAKLQSGQYVLRIRAVGYDLDGDRTVTVTPQHTETADLRLKKTTDLAGQLTNAEWMMSMPGTDAQKRTLLDCASCHNIYKIVSSRYSAEEFIQVIPRMATYAPGSTPLQPERRINTPRPRDPQQLRALAEYLASVNLSSGSTWRYQLKTLPRPTGRAARVIVTEYDLPRRVTEPHDVILDGAGTAWYTDFGTQVLGQLDPKTGKVTEYQVPTLKPGYANGELDLEIDKTGNLWMGMMLQGGVAQFDLKTKAFKTWPLPPQWNDSAAQIAMVTPPSSDGVMWTNDVDKNSAHRLNLKTGQWETFGPLTDGKHNLSIYGLYADSQNNAYAMDFSVVDGNNVGKIDAKTGAVTFIPTPTKNARLRRGRFDSQDRLWFAEYAADQIGMYDAKSGRITEWPLPTRWTAPYDVVIDKSSEVWTGSMWSDRITRLDTKTGKSVEYLLPRPTNIRRVFVDNSTTPVTFWTGSNHGASIIRLEPAD